MGSNRSFLFLHSSEWNRLKNQGALTKKPPEKNCYIESLIEQSQNWIKSWPDTVQGHIIQIEKQKEKQYEKDIEDVKLFEIEKKRVRKSESIEKARRMIFDDSYFGRQLISALIESKTLEERDIQVEFENKLKLNSEALQQRKNSCVLQSNNTKNIEKVLQFQKRQKDKEVAFINKAIYISQTEEKKREREKQIQMELEDMRAIQELIEKENADTENYKRQIKHDIKHFEKEQKIIKEKKADLKKKEELVAEVWRNYEERKRNKINKILKKSLDTPQFTKNYELTKKLKDEEEREYDEFVNNAVNVQEIRTLKKEQDEKIKAEMDREQCVELMQTNIKLAEDKRVMEANQNKNVSVRQNVITKCNKNRNIKEICSHPAPSFLTKNRGLLKESRKREEPIFPWNGLKTAHAQFAQQAGETLKQCRYKKFARKVVDEYRRLHCLDSTSLPVSNY